MKSLISLHSRSGWIGVLLVAMAFSASGALRFSISDNRPRQPAYNAGLTRALSVEWARHGVTVNAIAPGVFETDLNREILKGARGQEFKMRTPMGRFGRVEELVGAAVYLASGAASFVTGQLIAVDGGFLASGVNQ